MSLTAVHPMHLLLVLKTECGEQEREKKMPEAVKEPARDPLISPSIPLFDVLTKTERLRHGLIVSCP